MMKTDTCTVLHIAPHLGGGVGKVLLNYLAYVQQDVNFVHRVLCLDYANDKALLASKTVGFPLRHTMTEHPADIFSEMAAADVVLVHWWNHPLLYAFLVRETLPPARVIFWSHISGLHAPYVFNSPALHYPDLFVFTSPVSLETPEVMALSEARQEKLRVIWSTGGVENVASLRMKPHEGFRIGYIGTVDYSKLHPDFLPMSSGVKITEARFIVCGGPNEKDIQRESLLYDRENRFVFTGQVDGIEDYLSEFDVFGYPLAPYHYGTCEQSLGESMAAGVPPVVLSNKPESYIVDDGVTGIVARDENDYARALEALHRQPEWRQHLSHQAREAAQKKYSLRVMAKRWEEVFSYILGFPKTERIWPGRCRGKSVSARDIFLEALGPYGTEFRRSLLAKSNAVREEAQRRIRDLYESSHLWRARTRGTARHYHDFFPEDPDLKRWAHVMNDDDIITHTIGEGS